MVRIAAWTSAIAMACLVTTATADLRFPAWLRDVSGLDAWPGNEPPYIEAARADLSDIQSVPLRGEKDCSEVLPEHCSFDCGHCIVESDIHTCFPISQSFDDGPTDATAELLDGLKRAKAKTTFFLIGQNIVEFPHIVRREHKEGHLLAVHTWTHRFLPSLTDEEVFAELQWCIWAINASAGVVPRYFRPPYGGLDNRIRDIAVKLSLVPVLWDRDTDDWQLGSGERSAANILSEVAEWKGEGLRPRQWWAPKAQKASGLILEHDLTRESVQVGLSIRKMLNVKQKTVAQCANARPYS